MTQEEQIKQLQAEKEELMDFVKYVHNSIKSGGLRSISKDGNSSQYSIYQKANRLLNKKNYTE
jgi:hypothetical protein